MGDTLGWKRQSDWSWWTVNLTGYGVVRYEVRWERGDNRRNLGSSTTDLAARTTWPGILEAGPLGRVGNSLCGPSGSHIPVTDLFQGVAGDGGLSLVPDDYAQGTSCSFTGSLASGPLGPEVAFA